jgi:putative membrane protein insertion efficiency factor
MTGLLLFPQLIAATMSTRPRRGSTMVGMIRWYQREVSTRRPAVCRFSPSCSEYAAQAIDRHHAVRGLLLAGRRLLRCRPGGARGDDPVPA